MSEIADYYSLAGGITITRESFDVREQVWQKLGYLIIAGELFDTIDPSDPLLKPERLSVTVDGHKLGFAHWQRSDARLLHFGSWGADPEFPSGDHATKSIASIISDKSVTSYCQPGHGQEYRSSPWTSLARQGFRNGTFLPAGKYIAGFYESLLATDDILDMAGTSMGGRVAIGVMNALGRPVRNLVTYDPPGSRQFPFPAFVHRFARTERRHASQYMACSSDAKFREAQLQAQGGHLEHIRDNFRHGALRDFYFREPFALSRAGLLHDLVEADFSMLERFVFLYPTYGALQDTVGLRSALTAGAKKHASTRFELWSFPATHAFAIATGSAVARLYEAAMQRQVK